MDVVQLETMARRCIAGQPPACQHACPLNVDILDMVKKMQSGGVSAAFRTYSKSAVFPAITCRICPAPCGASCVRQQVDAAIDLLAMERGMTEQMVKRPASNYYMVHKEQKILVVGGGMAGLACAVKFAQNGYPVQLLEKSGRLGGQLWDIDEATLPRDVLQNELERVTNIKDLEILLNTEVTDLSAYDFDAILVATGAGGESFGLQPSSGRGTYAGNGVFMAGSLLHPGQHPLESIREGIALYYMIEGYVKIQYIDDTELEGFEHQFVRDPDSFEAQQPPTPADPEHWTKAEMQEEANRCLLCSCQNCIDISPMLCYFKKTARKSLQDIGSTINKTEITVKVGLRQILGCTQCGLCKPVCPVDIDFKEVCIESRRMMHQMQSLPDPIYAFWLEDMAFSNSDEAAFFFAPPQNKTPAYLFFPGCQLAASDPLYVTGSYELLCKAHPGEVGIMTNCCGAPANWAGQSEVHAQAVADIRARWEEMGHPTLILACPSCREVFDVHLPDIKTTSLWQMLAEDPKIAARAPKALQGHPVSIFDPCTSKGHPEDQESIRKLVRAMGLVNEELPAHGDKARCCGHGGLVVSGAPGLAEEIAEQNLAMGANDYVTYCSNCRDSFAARGKTANHILDWLVRGEDAGAPRTPPDLIDRRRNRTEVKKLLLKEIWDVDFDITPEPYQELKLEIAPELLEKMNRALIHTDNAKKTIFEAEASKAKVFNPETGHFTAHLRQGAITYWVEYAPNDAGGFSLKNIYKHRMVIEEKPYREDLQA